MNPLWLILSFFQQLLKPDASWTTAHIWQKLSLFCSLYRAVEHSFLLESINMAHSHQYAKFVEFWGNWAITQLQAGTGTYFIIFSLKYSINCFVYEVNDFIRKTLKTFFLTQISIYIPFITFLFLFKAKILCK